MVLWDILLQLLCLSLQVLGVLRGLLHQIPVGQRQALRFVYQQLAGPIDGGVVLTDVLERGATNVSLAQVISPRPTLFAEGVKENCAKVTLLADYVKSVLSVSGGVVT